MGRLSENMADAMSIDETAFAEAFQLNRNQDELTQLLMAMTTRQLSSFEGNLRTLGYADLADPSTIQIFPKDFESKERVLDILDAYNASARAVGDEDRVITFTDIVGRRPDGTVRARAGVLTAPGGCRKAARAPRLLCGDTGPDAVVRVDQPLMRPRMTPCAKYTTNMPATTYISGWILRHSPLMRRMNT